MNVSENIIEAGILKLLHYVTNVASLSWNTFKTYMYYIYFSKNERYHSRLKFLIIIVSKIHILRSKIYLVNLLKIQLIWRTVLETAFKIFPSFDSIQQIQT